MEQTKNNKKLIFGGIFLLLAVLLLALLYASFRPKGRGNDDLIHIEAEIIFGDGTSSQYSIHTREEYLRGALEQEQLIQGTEYSSGLFVTEAAGIIADDSNQEWWCFTKNGDSLVTSIDSTPIEDGDHFEITLTTGY